MTNNLFSKYSKSTMLGTGNEGRRARRVKKENVTAPSPSYSSSTRKPRISFPRVHIWKKPSVIYRKLSSAPNPLVEHSSSRKQGGARKMGVFRRSSMHMLSAWTTGGLDMLGVCDASFGRQESRSNIGKMQWSKTPNAVGYMLRRLIRADETWTQRD